MSSKSRFLSQAAVAAIEPLTTSRVRTVCGLAAIAVAAGWGASVSRADVNYSTGPTVAVNVPWPTTPSGAPPIIDTLNIDPSSTTTDAPGNFIPTLPRGRAAPLRSIVTANHPDYKLISQLNANVAPPPFNPTQICPPTVH